LVARITKKITEGKGTMGGSGKKKEFRRGSKKEKGGLIWAGKQQGGKIRGAVRSPEGPSDATWGKTE